MWDADRRSQPTYLPRQNGQTSNSAKMDLVTSSLGGAGIVTSSSALISWSWGSFPAALPSLTGDCSLLPDSTNFDLSASVGSAVLRKSELSSRYSRLQASQRLEMPGSLMGRKVNEQRPITVTTSYPRCDLSRLLPYQTGARQCRPLRLD